MRRDRGNGVNSLDLDFWFDWPHKFCALARIVDMGGDLDRSRILYCHEPNRIRDTAFIQVGGPSIVWNPRAGLKRHRRKKEQRRVNRLRL